MMGKLCRNREGETIVVKKTLSSAKMEKEKSTRNEKWRSQCGMMKDKNEQAKGGTMAV